MIHKIKNKTTDSIKWIVIKAQCHYINKKNDLAICSQIDPLQKQDVVVDEHLVI